MLDSTSSDHPLVGRIASSIVVGYLIVSVLLRIGWVVVAVGNLGFADAKYLTFTLESSVLLLLTYDVHPELTNGLDDSDDDFFESDRGIRVLVMLAVAILAIPVIPMTPAHLPHSVGDPIHHIFPAFRQSILGLLGAYLALAGVTGAYLYVRQPGPDGVVCRVLRSFTHARADPATRYHVDRVERTFAAAELTPFVVYSRVVTSFAVGGIVMLVATIMAVIATGVFLVPRLLVLVVVAWLARDVVTHQFEVHDGLRQFIWEVSEEVEAPKKWFLSMRVIGLGLKGATALFFLGVATLLAAMILSFFLQFAVEIGSQLPDGLEAVRWVLFEVGPADVPRYWNRLTVVLAVVSTAASLILLPFLWGGFLLLVWYSLMDRLAAWAHQFPDVGDELVEVCRLPWQVDLVLPVVSLGLPVVLGEWYVSLPVEYTDTVTRSWLAFSGVYFGLFALTAYAFYRGLRYRSSVIVPAAQVGRDNHRIPAYITALVLGFALVTGTGEGLVAPDLVAFVPLFLAAYYLRDIDHRITTLDAGYYRTSVLQITYIAGTVVLTVLTIRFIYPAARLAMGLLVAAIPVLYLDLLIRYVTDRDYRSDGCTDDRAAAE